MNGAIEMILLGLVASVATQLIKKLSSKIGGPLAMSVTFGVTVLFALGYTLFKEFAPAEVVQLVFGSFGLAAVWYSAVLKKVKL